MNEVAHMLQQALEQSWNDKEEALAVCDFPKAAAIRDWGERLKKLIAEARKLTDPSPPIIPVQIDPYVKPKGKQRFAVIPLRRGRPARKEFDVRLDKLPAYYHSDGVLDMTEVEKAIRFDMQIYSFDPAPEWQPPEFDGLTVKKYDGSGDLCDVWVLHDVKIRSMEKEYEDEPQYVVQITYGLPIEHKIFKQIEML